MKNEHPRGIAPSVPMPSGSGPAALLQLATAHPDRQR